MNTRKVVTAKGVRLEQYGVVLSEILKEPGPTHSIFDVLAIAADQVSVGDRCGLLGFAGGGVLAPLRASGSDLVVDGVDLDDTGYQEFRRICSKWAGDVRFSQEDALQWLERDGDSFDVIIEDLSEPQGHDVFKPDLSFGELPGAIRRRLAPGGGLVINLLRRPDQVWAQLLGSVTFEGEAGFLVSFDDFMNKILIIGVGLEDARTFSRKLRRALWSIGSDLSDAISVRSWCRNLES